MKYLFSFLVLWSTSLWGGSKLNLRLSAWPKSMNKLTSSDAYLSMVAQFVHATLIETDQKTLEIIPSVAQKWTVSKDTKTVHMTLNPKATFDDGSVITSEDVLFTFNLVYDKKKCVLCESTRTYIGPVKAVSLDKHSMRFDFEREHFANLQRLESVPILQKKVYEKGDFNRDFDRTLSGAGPYIYHKKKSRFRKKIVLKKRKNHWHFEQESHSERSKFDTVVFKYIQDDTVAFESFKKKSLSVFYFSQATYRFWDQKQSFPFTDKQVQRVEAPLLNPSRWGGIALNMRTGILKDKKIRKAFQLLLDRETITQKKYGGHVRPVVGPFMEGTSYSAGLPAIKYQPKSAAAYLKEAGFVKIDDQGVLYREIIEEGKKIKQRASLEVLYANKDHEAWLTLYKADAREQGVEIKPRFLDWSALIKSLDGLDFQGCVIGWVGDPIPSPNQLWHSRSAKQKGTSNISGFEDAEVNKWIEEGTSELQVQKRYEIYHKMERRIVDEQPYIFTWTGNKHYASYWSHKVNPTDSPFHKFSGSLEVASFFLHWQPGQQRKS
ncbi:MAG: ABC transporter substrate-binding protein [Oligoflexales bacterium]